MLSVVYLPLHGNRFISIVCLRNFHVLRTFIKIAYSPPSSRSLALSVHLLRETLALGLPDQEMAVSSAAHHHGGVVLGASVD